MLCFCNLGSLGIGPHHTQPKECSTQMDREDLPAEHESGSWSDDGLTTHQPMQPTKANQIIQEAYSLEESRCESLGSESFAPGRKDSGFVLKYI